MVIEGNNSIAIMRAINGATNPVNALPGTIRGDLALETGRNIVLLPIHPKLQSVRSPFTSG